MKYLFFLVLLGNIVFFLWEISSGVETTDGQRVLFGAEREKLILLLSEIDLDETAEKIGAKIKKKLSNPAAYYQDDNGISNSGLQPFSEREQDELMSERKLIQIEGVTKLPDTEQHENIINEEPSENLEAGPQVNSDNERIEIPTKELEYNSEETVDVGSSEDRTERAADENEQQTETENQIVQFVSQKPDVTPEQDIKNLSCYEIGPFADKKGLHQWQNQLEDGIVFLEMQSRNIEEIKDYMIIYPAAESYEKSEENASKLRELGINDIWLFEKGDNRGAISLGLFDSKSAAEKARERYKQDGLSVQINPRFRDVQRFFISLELDEQQHNKILQHTPGMENIELSFCA